MFVHVRSLKLVFAALLMVLVLADHCRAEKTFFWTMESETPDIYAPGSDSTPYYYPPPENLRKTTQAYSGQYSLDVSGGAWRAATFDNPTNDHVWTSPQEGAISFMWKFTGNYPESGMLFQLTGKSKVAALDTNDGIGIRLKGSKLTSGYFWATDDDFGTTPIEVDNGSPFVANQWYQVIIKWNKAGPITLSMQIDNKTPVTSSAALHDMTLVAFHQILIGNDRNFAPDGLFIDDFAIYNDFAMTNVPEPTGAAAVLGVIACAAFRRSRPYR
jgi:hypothetical protein